MNQAPLKHKRPIFAVESKKRKIKIVRHRVIEDGYI